MERWDALPRSHCGSAGAADDEAHYDVADNILGQCLGTKRIRCWAPSSPWAMAPSPTRPAARKARSLGMPTRTRRDSGAGRRAGDPGLWFHHCEARRPRPCSSRAMAIVSQVHLAMTRPCWLRRGETGTATLLSRRRDGVEVDATIQHATAARWRGGWRVLRASTPPPTQSTQARLRVHQHLLPGRARVEINQCVGCTAMPWPPLRRAVRNRHRPPSSMCRIDGVEVDADQDKRAQAHASGRRRLPDADPAAPRSH